VKYVVSWEPRAGGSFADNEASAARFDALAREWTPSDKTRIHQMVVRVDGEGGFAIIETDDPAALADSIYRFAPQKKYTLHPVVDYDQGLRIARKAQEFRAGVKLQ
jgi:hypothetical protein